MKAPVLLLLLVSLVVLGPTARAETEYSPPEWQAPVAPESELGQRAVKVALSEFERHGLDREKYTSEIYDEGNSILVIFHDTTVVRSATDLQVGPASDLVVTLDKGATRVVKYYFCCK